ncbi:MAG: L-fuculokinase [Firmicutes bacterium ADurb.Bin182]|nr:MAG: L-fuculokinase [Firmicutes bacterium ADurb.Bin182]
MEAQKNKSIIQNGETYLGIELGSTRIKAVLIDKEHNRVAEGSESWENRFENGIWTYSLDDIWSGIRKCYLQLYSDVYDKFGVKLEKVGAIGISAMMHGYMAFSKDGKLLVPFRTWRNTMTADAAEKLSKLFGFNIPQRWSIAHLYQAILNGEEHVSNISFLTTLSGYIHRQLTGEKALGIGDASGMFPVDDATRQFDSRMLKQFDELIAGRGFAWKIADILPRVLPAGEKAGVLTEEGARLLDTTGTLKAGILLCPPEGDAGTGMVATNSIRKRTGNISAGTSVFAMSVLEKPLKKAYPEIDMVTTPSGNPVAMVHCNNCTSDMDAWIKLLGEAAALLGAEFDTNALYNKLLNSALDGDADCGGLLSYNYVSGEHVTGFSEGRPLFMRTPDANFSLANFIRAHLYSACASLKIGMDILLENEHIELDFITGHGGFFKVPGIGQRVMASALKVPVSVMATAGEGGPWGMAILAKYAHSNGGKTLADYLSDNVFANAACSVIEPNHSDSDGFREFMERFKSCLAVEKAAVNDLNIKRKSID